MSRTQHDPCQRHPSSARWRTAYGVQAPRAHNQQPVSYTHLDVYKRQRQLVSHKHVTVNGEVVNIPSQQLRAGDVIAVRDKSKSLEAITNSVAGRVINKFSWLDWNASELTGKFLSYPQRDEIPENIKENLIVELYSK